jgi:hypothetical protein
MLVLPASITFVGSVVTGRSPYQGSGGNRDNIRRDLWRGIKFPALGNLHLQLSTPSTHASGLNQAKFRVEPSLRWPKIFEIQASPQFNLAMAVPNSPADAYA